MRLAEGSCPEAFCAVLEVGEVIHLVTKGLLHGTILKTSGVAEGVAAEAAELRSHPWRTCQHCQIYCYMTPHYKKVIIVLAGFLLSVCNNLHTFILVLCLEKRSLDKLGLRAFQCRSGQVNKAQTFYDLFLMRTFCITLVFHTSLAVMSIADSICLSSVLLWGSLMDISTLHLGAEQWWRMTSGWWRWWRRQAFDMHWRWWSRELHSPV